jgi:pyruvate kinase
VELRDALERIHGELLQLEGQFGERLAEIHPSHRRSAINLIHYLALRRHDIREAQEQLASLGLSSLGRTESHVAAGIEAVLRVLHHLTARGPRPGPPESGAVDFDEGTALLRTHTEALLGPPPAGRAVRIMVTMPSEAGLDYHLVRRLVARGMNCMRINCAHDDEVAWAAMVANLRRAERELGTRCHVAMDLAGPKLRTGAIDPSTQIVKWRPLRDERGRVTDPARIWLTAAAAAEPAPSPCAGSIRLPADALAALKRGGKLRFRDLRDKRRVLTVEKGAGNSWWASLAQTAYLEAEGTIALCSAGTPAVESVAGEVGAPPAAESFLLLRPGDILVLTRAPTPGRPALRDAAGSIVRPAAISCTLPQVFGDVRAKELIWFDDGRIGGVIESVSAEELVVRITVAKAGGDKLRADKGINLPDSELRLPALTEKDIADLAFVVEHADLVGYSFVKRPEDIRALHAELARLGAEHLGIILKIETRTAFEQLPNLILAAMRSERVGVMIARGDLAVECGWERLAEVQEEILWVCEAAHVPVIWATQVLESLAKRGAPSRAEITDAAMGERAECVMLNKGPYLADAVRVLDDILRRMEAHQSKKTARLRQLRLSAITPG